MNRIDRFAVLSAWALAAILAVGCVGVGPASPTPTVVPTSSIGTPTATPTATPSPSPSTTAAPPSPTVAPTATPTPVSGDAVMAGFADYLETDSDFHIVCTLTGDFYVGIQHEAAFVIMDGDISGQDFAGYFSVQTAGLTIEADMVVIGDLIYVRPARGNWQPGEEFAQTQPLNPITGVDVEYTYQGTATIDGRTLHTMHTDEWVGGNVQKVGRQAGLKRPVLESTSFDVFVDDTGLPVTSLLEFVVTGRLQGQEARLEYSVIYDFSNIGQPVTIEAPI